MEYVPAGRQYDVVRGHEPVPFAMNCVAQGKPLYMVVTTLEALNVSAVTVIPDGMVNTYASTSRVPPLAKKVPPMVVGVPTARLMDWY